MTRAGIAGTQLNDVLQDFATSSTSLAERLSHFAKLFPQYENHLRALAAELAEMDASKEEVLSAEGEKLAAFGSSAFIKALQEQSAEPVAAHDVFAGRSPKELQKLALNWALPLTLLAKIRDRLIDPETIPSGFVAWLAKVSGERKADILYSLSLPPRMGAALQYKATGKPTLQERQSFKDAVEATDMPEQDKRKLKAFLD